MAREEQASEVLLLISQLYGDATASALQRVAELLIGVEASLGGTVAAAYPAILNLAMILKQVDDSCRYRTPPLSGKKFQDRTVLKRAARCAKFVSAACMSEKRAIAAYVGELQADDIKCLAAPSGPQRPGYLVAVDHHGDEIVVCVNHGGLAADASTELDCLLQPLGGGNAHPDMLECAKNVILSTATALTSLALEFPRKAVTITGHGLGAATAALALMLLCSEGGPLREKLLAGRVHCCTFGAPPSFEPLWALPACVRNSTYSFVNGMDYVPRLSLASLSRLLVAVKEVDRLPLTSLQRLGFLKGKLDMDYRLPDCVLVQGERPSGNLSVVGNILLIYKGDKNLVRCERMPSALCDQLLLHRDMVNDHIMPLYEQMTADVGLSSEV